MTDPTINQTVVGDHNVFTATGNIVVYELPPSDAEDRRNLLMLLERVEQFWVKDVFEKTVRPENALQLGKKTEPDAVEHPWKLMLGSAEQASEEIPSDKNIEEVFDQTGRLLLILGEPGSGKTTTLLELTRFLIASAVTNPTKPIPVVFLLSSWSQKRQPIFEWLVDELNSKYYIPPELGRSFLKSNRLLPLLDGLDEVSASHRSACVDAINRFARDVGTPGLVVTCRLNEYGELSRSLGFNGAIHLQALSTQQIDRHLEERGEEQAALRTLLNNDHVLRELAASPLMLDVMVTAYQNLPLEMLNDDRLNTADARKENIFQTYVNRMFDRTGRTSQPFTREQTLVWMSLLAKKMTFHTQSIFLIERIQPSWLSNRLQLFLYLLISRTAAGLLIGLPLMFLHLGGNEPFVEELGAVIFVLVWTFIMGLLAAFPKMWQSKEAYKPNSVQKIPSRWRIVLHVLIQVFVGGVLGGLLAVIAGWLWISRVLGTLTPSQDSVGLAQVWYFQGQGAPDAPLLARYIAFLIVVAFSGMFIGWFYGLLFGLVIGVRDKKRNLQDDVQTAETIEWSSERAKKAVRRVFHWAIAISAVLIAPLLVIGFIADHVWFLYYKWPVLLLGKHVAVTVGVMVFTFVVLTLLLWFPFGTIGAIFRGLKTGARVEMPDLSNQGIKSSLKKSKYKSIYKSIYAGIIVGIVLGVMDVLMKLIGVGFSRMPNHPFGPQEFVLSDVLFREMIVLVSNGMLAFLWYGGLDLIKHYTLRLILLLKGESPLRFDSFLDYAVRLGFMRRVGGGYIFYHSMLRNYFAGLGR